MLLIVPPSAKPGEPPAGAAKIAGALKAHAVPCTVLDANLEGMLFLLGRPQHAADTWTRRAVRNLARNVDALRQPATYASPARYSRAVTDLNRVLQSAGAAQGVTAGLADYQDRVLSPLRSSDLIEAALHPDKNLFYPYFSRRLPQLMDAAPRIVGFSLNYLSQALCTFAMIGFIRKEFPRVMIALGGGLVTSWMKRPGWKNPFAGLVDHVISGPGETQLLSLCGVDGGEEKPFLPDYSGAAAMGYLSPGFVLPYSASSGCYWNRCSFCPEPNERNSYIPVPVDAAHGDIVRLAKDLRPSLIHLLDNAVNPGLLRTLAQNPPGAPWYGFARFEHDLADPDFCKALRRAGCVMLKLGLESGDQRVLEATRKGINLETASRILHNLRGAGIATYVYLLFGTPQETRTEALNTLSFVRRHREAVTFLNLAIFNMPCCGPDIEKYETHPFSEGDLSLYTDFRHPAGWSRREVRRFLDLEFKRDPAVAAILRNDPPVFTSNHAPFFVVHKPGL